MKKALSVLLLLSVLCLTPVLASASIAYPGVVQVRDASGQLISTYHHGDEFFSYSTDTSGKLLVRDGAGNICYVVSPDGQSLAVGDPVVPNPLLRSSNGLGEGVRADAVSDLRKKLTTLYADIAASTPALFQTDPYAPVALPKHYNHDDPDDPLNGYWVTFDEDYHAPANPPRQDVCPLLVLKVEFDDVECLFDDDAWSERIFGTDSVSSYYAEVSDGQFTYIPAEETGGDDNDGVITVRLPIKRPLYEPRGGVGQNYSQGAHAGLYASSDGKNQKYAIFNDCSIYAYALLEAAADIDFASYDVNDDGFISPTELAVLTVTAGYEAAYVSGLSSVGRPMTWAHSWMANTYLRDEDTGISAGWQGAIQVDGVSLFKYTTIGENLNGDYDYTKSPAAQAPGVAGVQAPIGTPCHELGHDLGLMDLYDTTYTVGHTAEVLSLSLMASGNWGYKKGEPLGSSPVHLDPFSKAFLDFYDPITVGMGGTYPMAQASDTAEYRILQVNTADPDVYYLIENRTFTGFDAGMRSSLSGPGGIVCWRIDNEVVQDNWAYNQINAMPGHYGIMPVYISYDGPYSPDTLPFRNSETYDAEPLLELSGSGLWLSSPDVTAARMNAWLLPLELVLELDEYSFGNAPDELLAILDTEAGLSPSDLQDVQVDGRVLLIPNECEVRKGSIIIALQKAYLSTLAPGTHVLRATLKNGVIAEAQFVVTAAQAAAAAAAPSTGDRALPLVWLGLIGLATVGILVLIRFRKHRIKE